MSDTTFSTSDLSRKSGDIIAEALRRPVTITQRKKPRLVVMNVEDYERLRAQADPRKAGYVAELSPETFQEISDAMRAYVDSEDE